MLGSDASYQTCERIVSREIYRIKGRRIGSLDEDDLKQELIWVAISSAPRADGRPGDAYVRRSVRNAIAQMYAHVSAAKRHPQDRFGRPVWFANPDIIEMSQDEAIPDPEALATARERVDWLISTLPPAEAALVERAARGEIELTDDEALHISYTRTGGRMADEYAVPIGSESDLASCHVRGDKPEGYDASESECRSCMDKFTCLPEAVAKPDVWTDRYATVWTIGDDHEVAGVLARELTYGEARDRVVKRVELTDDDHLIPAELLVRKVADVVDPQPPAEAEDEPESPADPDPSAGEPPTDPEATVSAKKKTKKKAAKKKAPKRPAKKAAAKKAPAKKAPARPRRPSVTRPTAVTKSLPKPQTITEEKMVAMLGRVKLGKRIELDWGMQIARKKRDGSGEDVATITKSGFLYNDKHYSSLSAVAQNASGTFCRSGNDWFNMRHPGTEVRTAKGKVIASRNIGS